MDRHEFPLKTPESISSMEELEARLPSIRKQKYTINGHETIEGVSAIAAPIAVDGKVHRAVSIAEPVARFEQDSYRQSLIDLVTTVSNNIGLKPAYECQEFTPSSKLNILFQSFGRAIQVCFDDSPATQTPRNVFTCGLDISGMADTAADLNKRYKVGRVISKYGLTEFLEELPARWLGEDHESQSLRELADYLNVEILREAMESENLQPLDGEVENTYRLLTGDGVSSGMRTAKRNELERDGLDVGPVEDDFVTHQAIYTYLTEVLDVSKQDQEDEDPIEKHSERINRLRSRTQAVATNTLDSLVDNNVLEVGDPEISVTIQVYCDRCNRQYPLSSLLSEGGCDCAK